MPKKVEGPEQLLMEELQDLLDAEKQLVRALPKMAKSASDERLENAFREHLEVTKGQVQRLERVFATMDARPRSRPCRGMQGIVEEGEQVAREKLEERLLDTAIASSCRKVEHYEMAGYESARALAQQIGMKEASQLLQETLREEIEADRILAQISKQIVKEAMSQPRGEEQIQRRAARQTGNGRRGVAAKAQGKRGQSRAAGRASARRTPGGRPSGRTRLSAHPMMDHEEIRRWAEERGAHPACVRRTGGRGDIGMIRLDFPGYSGERSLEPISWDEWFEKFDEKNLALMVQEETAGGERSNFNKLVSRATVEERPKVRTAR